MPEDKNKNIKNLNITGRFAPSPSGRMHLGNLFCYLIAWLSIRQQGGRVILRMEDLDIVRCPARYSVGVLDDLNWLGLDWDEGPYYQSQRSEFYQAKLDELEKLNLLYPCFCTRADLKIASAPHMSDGKIIYAGTCRNLTPEKINLLKKTRKPSWRLKTPDEIFDFIDGHMGYYAENLNQDCGDFILKRSDGLYAYQLAVVLDDADMGVTEVTRGADLLSSTPRQLYLYQIFHFTPPKFYHIPLLLAPDGRRLSKRDRDMGLDILRGRYQAREILGKLAYLAGIHPDASPVSLEDLITKFNWNLVPRENIIVPDYLF